MSAETAIKERGEIIGELERWQTRHESLGSIVKKKSGSGKAVLIEVIGDLCGRKGIEEAVGGDGG
tara:strand:- start:2908 stop:3102 length:195 start_codon:yes stop_codon:yes gene_type:complete